MLRKFKIFRTLLYMGTPNTSNSGCQKKKQSSIVIFLTKYLSGVLHLEPNLQLPVNFNCASKKKGLT